MPELDTDVRFIKGIGEQRAKALEKLGIRTLLDLVSYFPRSYEDRRSVYPIAQAPLEENCCICAMVAAPPKLSRVRRGLELVRLRVVDESGAADLTFFNQPYVRDLLKPGETYQFYGKLSGNLTRRTMTNPLFEKEANKGGVTGRIVAKYRLTAGLSQKLVSAAVRQGLDACAQRMPVYLPEDVRAENALASAPFSYENIHFPASEEALELARRRLIFEEFFTLACAIAQMGGRRREGGGALIPRPDFEEFYRALPFAPTAAQRRAAEQAAGDMASGAAMNRLVQGDVGSGKTLVAAACAWSVCRAGHQCAFMAPTEILAEQHFETLSALLAPFSLRIAKLTGSMPARERRAVTAALAVGEIDLAIGTHALLSEDVAFADLALVITDEQHRFGVQQRSALSSKARRPHVMVMSATPIPRTLALMIYGDLDISVIDELPPGRQRVETFLVDESYRERINAFIRKLVSQGRQVFIVCPMIEEDEDSDPSLKSAEAYAKELQEQVLPELRVACVHGKMKAKAKDAVMADFAAGKADILVSTTVIEVGVDVPNAALMIIENAERFGLSQLHQLRGRVGRGKHQSYCVLFSQNTADATRERLKVLCQTNDGFKISEEDLRLRGPGDFFGDRQHGLPEMHIASLCADMTLLEQARESADKLLRADPALELPEHGALRRRVEDLLRKAADTFN